MRLAWLACVFGCYDPNITAGDGAGPAPDGRVEDATIVDAISCPADLPLGCEAVPCEGKPSCYVACRTDLRHDVAQTSCATFGAHLVTIEDEVENDCVLEPVKHDSSAADDFWIGAWIGLEQPLGQAAATDNWRWANGEALTYTNWRTSPYAGLTGMEPDDCSDGVTPSVCDETENDAEQCGWINRFATLGGTWADAPCGNLRWYVCEISPP